MFLFVDTETTGLNRISDRIVQIAWMITDRSGQLMEEENYIIKPMGFRIPTAASKIHGITNSKADFVGVPIEPVLKKFRARTAKARVVVAHNLDFDLAILRCELSHLRIPSDVFDDKLLVCTMKGSTRWCRLPKLNGLSGFKYPTLEELHYKLFGEYFAGAHDALADVNATRKCFFKLLDAGVIVIPERAFGHPQDASRSGAENGIMEDQVDEAVPPSEVAESPHLNKKAKNQYKAQEALQTQALNSEWIYFAKTATLFHAPSGQRFFRGQWEWKSTGFVLEFGGLRTVSVDEVAYR